MAENKGDLTGRTLGNFTLERLLGQGGMGAVYLAKQERPSRWVALKVLHPNIAYDTHGNEEFWSASRREADVIARLEHVNIMPIYEYGEQNGMAFLVMPYISGGSLKDVLIKRGSLSLAEATAYIDQAASALDYAHSQGVVHRDLKPANFLLHADGRLVLADFGIARLMEESLSTGATLTNAGTILGTPEYMAPEMASGGAIDYRADIYGLGVVLFQMLTGNVPFTGTTPYAVVIKQIQERLPPVQQMNPAIPATIDPVIQTATAKQPDKRYQTARAMSQALHQATDSAQNYRTLWLLLSGMHLSLPSPAGLWSSWCPDPRRRICPKPRRCNSQQPGSWKWLSALQNYPSSSHHGRDSISSPTKKRQPWGMILGVALLLVLVISGVVFGSQLIKGNNQDTQTSGQTNIPSSQNKPTPTTIPTQAPTPTTVPTQVPTPTPTTITIPNTLAVGDQIYATNRPGAGQNCDNQAGAWANFNGARSSCTNNRLRLMNQDQNNNPEGILLTKIPGQDAYPSNYVIQTQIQHENGKGDFGIFFRNQPGNDHQGAYTFLIHPDGTWSISVYDDANGKANEIKNGILNADPNDTLNLAVVANGPQLSIYMDKNLLATVTDATYPQGTVGLAVGAGATLRSNSFTLSNVAA